LRDKISEALEKWENKRLNLNLLVFSIRYMFIYIPSIFNSSVSDNTNLSL